MRMLRAAGFADEVTLMEQGDGMAGLSDCLLDAIWLLGSPERCQARRADYRAAGVGGACEAIQTFRQ